MNSCSVAIRLSLPIRGFASMNKYGSSKRISRLAALPSLYSTLHRLPQSSQRYASQNTTTVATNGWLNSRDARHHICDSSPTLLRLPADMASPKSASCMAAPATTSQKQSTPVGSLSSPLMTSLCTSGPARQALCAPQLPFDHRAQVSQRTSVDFAGSSFSDRCCEGTRLSIVKLIQRSRFF